MKHLTSWLAGIENHYGECIFPLDIEAARIWGELTTTDLRHGLNIMTRNLRYFEATGALSSIRSKVEEMPSEVGCVSLWPR